MKVFFILPTVLLAILALLLIRAHAGEDFPHPVNTIAFGKIQTTDGRARAYDPCACNPSANSACAGTCMSYGYVNGGLCIGYACYCYLN